MSNGRNVKIGFSYIRLNFGFGLRNHCKLKSGKTLELGGVARLDFRHLLGPVFELSDSLAVGRFGIYF